MVGAIVRMLAVWSLVVCAVAVPCNAGAAVLGGKDIPPALEPWKGWVLHGLEDRLCPTTYSDGQAYRCRWPSRLRLSVDGKGGRFQQQWQIYSAGWVALPGGTGTWPGQVEVDGQPAPVINRQGVPSVRLEPGPHRVDGAFVWAEMPEMIQVPPALGLVSLTINGRTVDFPVLDQKGRLWLQRRAAGDSESDRLEVRVYRMLEDDIPMRVTTLLRINVSGRARELKLDQVLLDGSVPMTLESPLPARIGPDGELLMQARPGRWEIPVVTRLPGPVRELGPVTGKYGQEVWAFAARNHLRMVKIVGVHSVDPTQTDVPSGWRELPTYLVEPGSVLTFEELRRGDADPAPDRLHLRRTWWLDFDGGGFTIQDKITGTMSREWRLSLNAPGILGRVSVDGKDQLITVEGDNGKPGVELRRGQLDLTADSRYEASISRLPAVGWDHDFETVSAVLNLPPGWRLLTARGVDQIWAWLDSWSLLDFFLVLIISLAVFRLSNWLWGVLALVTMTLIFHELGAPRLVWLHLLAALGLLRVLPEGRFRKLVNLWRLGAIVALLVLAVPFMVQQVRWGFYPQLERHAPVRPYWAPTRFMQYSALEGDVASGLPEESRLEEAPAPSWQYEAKQQIDQSIYTRKRALLGQDPNALIQTGPGLPTWKWRTIPMKWSGSVDRDQEVRLWLLPPSVGLVLALVRVVFLALLIYGMVDLRHWWRNAEKPAAAVVQAGLVLVLLASAGVASAQRYATPCPPPELLDQLRQRLLEIPDCMPHCADAPRMELEALPASVRIHFEVQAAVDTAVPLPGATQSWVPEEVLLDQMEADALWRDSQGVLWVLVPKGVHTVTLLGKTPPGNSFQIPLPLKPHWAHVRTEGWDVQGVRPNGEVEASLQLTRTGPQGSEAESMEQAALPPFLHVERVFLLGLHWEVVTTVTRLTPAGVPVVVAVPLTAGESVTTAGIRVEKGRALINMDPGTSRMQWTSTLPMVDELSLQSPEGVPWMETWILDVSPIWHCRPSGIPVIHHQDAEGHWRPEWRPWPGESVMVQVSRPQALTGQTLTIDGAELDWTPGQRLDRAVLSLTVRSSIGSQHKILLPEAAQLQQVTIDDESQPIRQEGRQVVVPLQPGSQKIVLEWQQKSGSSPVVTRAPEVEIGERAVNAKVTYHLPRNRWILWTAGPVFGPAVLFWSYLVVIVLAAVGLGRIRLTPLTTRHWLLLGLGLTQVDPVVAVVIVGWFIALGVRREHVPRDSWFHHNGVQVLLALLTAAAMVGLYMAIDKGLLGIPRMQIAGNNYGTYELFWIQDRIGPTMPRPWVWSLPLLIYRGLMLVWAMWIAVSLLKWLRWGWHCFSEGRLWRKAQWRRRRHQAEEEKEYPPPLEDDPPGVTDP